MAVVNGYYEVASVLLTAGANPNLPVVFSHPVYQYLKARYSINGQSVHWEPDAMPEERLWREFADLIRRHPAKWMIWEGKPLPEIARQNG